MVSGQIVLFGIMLPFYKREERAMSHKCLCFVFATALHPYAYSCSVIAENFVTYIEEKRVQLWRTNLVLAKRVYKFCFLSWKSLVDLCLHPSCFLNLQEGHCNLVFPRLKLYFLYCISVGRTCMCRTTGS